jgi:hypothetical protein
MTHTLAVANQKGPGGQARDGARTRGAVRRPGLPHAADCSRPARVGHRLGFDRSRRYASLAAVIRVVAVGMAPTRTRRPPA